MSRSRPRADFERYPLTGVPPAELPAGMAEAFVRGQPHTRGGASPRGPPPPACSCTDVWLGRRPVFDYRCDRCHGRVRRDHSNCRDIPVSRPLLPSLEPSDNTIAKDAGEELAA